MELDDMVGAVGRNIIAPDGAHSSKAGVFCRAHFYHDGGEACRTAQRLTGLDSGDAVRNGLPKVNVRIQKMQPAKKITAETPPLKVHPPETFRVYRNEETMLEKIGWKRLCAIVWRATPFPLRTVSFPYNVFVYAKFLANSETQEQVCALHVQKYTSSLLFRCLRPRYRQMKYLLL